MSVLIVHRRLDSLSWRKVYAWMWDTWLWKSKDGMYIFSLISNQWRSWWWWQLDTYSSSNYDVHKQWVVVKRSMIWYSDDLAVMRPWMAATDLIGWLMWLLNQQLIEWQKCRLIRADFEVKSRLRRHKLTIKIWAEYLVEIKSMMTRQWQGVNSHMF